MSCDQFRNLKGIHKNLSQYFGYYNDPSYPGSKQKIIFVLRDRSGNQFKKINYRCRLLMRFLGTITHIGSASIR